MTTGLHTPIALFVSFAHEDEALLRELEAHLSQLKRQGIISMWHDQHIAAGANVAQAFDEHLEQANIILLLVSSDFLASDSCIIQMQRALERYNAKAASVIAIVLRPCDWNTAPFAALPHLPIDGKPVTTWENRDAVWNEVVLGIRSVIDPTTNVPSREASSGEQSDTRTNWIENQGLGQRQVVGDDSTVHIHFPNSASNSVPSAPATQNHNFYDKTKWDWDKRTPLARELRTESFMLGDSEQFHYVRTPVQIAYTQATEALLEASENTNSSKRGILHGIFIVGESNAGKTRFAFEILKETLPTWPVLRWQPDFTQEKFPLAEFLLGKKVVLFLDDLQDYVFNEVRDADGRLIPSPSMRTLNVLLAELLQYVQRLIVLAICRRENRMQIQAQGRLNVFFSQLKEVTIPSFGIDTQELEAKQIIDEFQKYGTVCIDDWDGTLGSLVLGLSAKNSQYLSLPRSAKGILQSMKLLHIANILGYTEQRLRTVCAEVFAERTVLEDEQVWKNASRLLIQMQLVREGVNESTLKTELIIRKDSYFEKVVSDYPEKDRPQQVVQDLVKLSNVLEELRDAEALLNLGITYSNQKKYGQAKGILVSALNFDPTLSSGWFYLGLLHLLVGENEEARKANERAITFDRLNDLAYYNKGVALFQLRKYKEALEAIHKALDLNPQLTFAIVTQAKTLVALNNSSKALDILNASLADESFADNTLRIAMFMEKAAILSSLKLYQDELTVYLKVLAIDPSSFLAAFRKAATLDILKEYEQALMAYDYALQLNPHDIDTRNNKALVFKEMGRFAEAEQEIEDALKQDLNNGELWDSKGEILLAQKRNREASEAFAKAVRCSPENEKFRRNAAAATQHIKVNKRFWVFSKDKK